MRHICVSAAALLAALGVSAANAQQGGPPDKGGGAPAMQSPGGGGGGGMGKGGGSGPGAGADSAAPKAGASKGDAVPSSSPQRGSKQSESAQPATGKGQGKAASTADVNDAPSKGRSDAARKSEPKADGRAARTEPKSGKQGKADEPSKKAAEGKADPASKDSKAGTAGTKSGDADPKAGSASTGAATTGTADPSGRTKDGAAGKDRAATKAGADAVTRLPDQQRAQVRERFRANREARATNVNVSVAIGTRIPRSVRLYAVPAAVIAVVPEYRSYRYIIVDERICIIDPVTYEIVYIVDDGPGRRARAALELTAEERRIILTSIPEERLRRKVDIRFSTGVAVPATFELVEFPDRVVSEVPELRSYRYVAGDGHVAVVDPDNRTALIIVD